MAEMKGLGYKNGTITAFGRWWLLSGGGGLSVRYAAGRIFERLFGYDPEGQGWPHRLARWANLSGY